MVELLFCKIRFKVWAKEQCICAKLDVYDSFILAVLFTALG